MIKAKSPEAGAFPGKCVLWLCLNNEGTIHGHQAGVGMFTPRAVCTRLAFCFLWTFHRSEFPSDCPMKVKGLRADVRLTGLTGL